MRFRHLQNLRGRHETDRFLNWFRPVEHFRHPLHGSGQISERTKTSLDLLFGSHGTLGTVQCFEQYCNLKQNRPFYRYGDHIEFTRVKEYYGMPRGALTQYLRALFGQKENFSVYFSGKRRSFPITIFLLGNRKGKLARKALVNTERISHRVHARWASHNTL